MSFCAKTSVGAHRSAHLHKLKPAVELGNKVGGSRVGDSRDGNQTPVERHVFTDTLTERSALEIENKGRDLLGKTKQVDGSVEQTWLKLLLEVTALSKTIVNAAPLG